MVITLNDEINEQLNALAAQYGGDPDAYVGELLDQAINRGGTLPQGYVRPLKTSDWVRALKPACPATDGTNGLHRIVGKWPGDETEEELLSMEREIDD